MTKSELIEAIAARGELTKARYAATPAIAVPRTSGREISSAILSPSARFASETAFPSETSSHLPSLFLKLERDWSYEQRQPVPCERVYHRSVDGARLGCLRVAQVRREAGPAEDADLGVGHAVLASLTDEDDDSLGVSFLAGSPLAPERLERLSVR